MKLLNTTGQNIAGLVVIIVLAAVMFQLVRGQMQSPQAAQVGPTATTAPTSTAAPPPAAPTVTIWPTSNATPITTDPYPIFQVTPIPGPTYTPTPVVVEAVAVPPPIKVIDRRKLPLDQLRPLSSMADEDVPTYALFEPVGWTEQGEVVLQERRLIERDGTYFSDTLYQVINTVAVLPDTGAVKPLSDWSPPGPAVVHGFMDSVIKGPLWVIHGYNNEGITVLDWGSIPGWSSTQQKLAAKWAAKKPITYPQDWLAAPDGETVILQIRKEKIYILKPGYSQPIILPQNKEGVSAFVTAVTAQLSPDGQRIVYGVRFENPDSNDSYGRETDTYEIQTSSLNGNSITSIKLDYEYSYPREWAWSPNGEYIAFIAQPENHSPLHLYVAKSDGSSIIDLVSDDFWAAGPLYWSKDGGKLIYIGGNPDKQDSVGYWIISFLK